MREMKDSGIEWIGEIPKEWKIIKCKYTAILYTGNSIKDEEKANYEDSTNAIPYIATKDIDVTFSTVDYENGLYINNDDLSFSRANAGDTLMCIEGGSAGRKKALLDRKVCFVNKLCCFHPLTIESSFLYYILNSPHYEEEFRFNISGLIGGVSKNKLLNFVFPFPPLSEQQKISAYLDTKCNKIDSIIEKQEKVIEKLKEYKLSVITEAVTKGLNPDVKMKDSGVEWIGEIPEKWMCINLIRTADKNRTYAFGDGDHGLIKTEDYKTEGIPFIRVQNVGWCEELDLENVVYISEKDNQRIANSTLRPGDILFVKTGGTIGKTGIIPESLKIANTTSHVGKISISPRFCNKYILYLLSSHVGYRQFWAIASQKATRPELGLEEVKAVKITVPPNKSEQEEIVSYLDKKCSAIDKSIEQKQAIIEKLKEYKKSLIYEVVTGKREV